MVSAILLCSIKRTNILNHPAHGECEFYQLKQFDSVKELEARLAELEPVVDSEAEMVEAAEEEQAEAA